MKENEIFFALLSEAHDKEDPEGVVMACLVKDGEILISSPSDANGIRHAEDLVLEKANKQGINIDSSIELYTTLEPCSYRSPRNKVDNCTTIIIGSGIQNVIYAASDPAFSKEARMRFEAAGVKYRQINNPKIIEESVRIFNKSIKKHNTIFGQPREK